MSATAVRQKRQITLPQDVFKVAGLKVGDQVDWQVEGGDIRRRKFVADTADVLEAKNVDSKTLLPRSGRITAESIVKSVQEGRERK
jgi:bifunctional DNA-binding transcriptional regulator/antitoxin component of YhaV-PrlF toxin-antitoxin module